MPKGIYRQTDFTSQWFQDKDKNLYIAGANKDFPYNTRLDTKAVTLRKLTKLSKSGKLTVQVAAKNKVKIISNNIKRYDPREGYYTQDRPGNYRPKKIIPERKREFTQAEVKEYLRHGGLNCPSCNSVDVYESNSHNLIQLGKIGFEAECYRCGVVWLAEYKLENATFYDEVKDPIRRGTKFLVYEEKGQ